jgi:dissimilatory sulfite reductase (desulfoviridin) alpha/beta subunit
MQWESRAEAAMGKVPFFVRKKVRRRVEDEARAAGKTRVTLDEVKAAQQRYLSGMHQEVRGFQVENCFGLAGCPNRACADERLIPEIEGLLEQADLLGFLKTQVKGPLKFHHEFRVAVADCPNACSQPQIRDVAVIGACRPALTPEPCSGCGACVQACAEQAVSLDSDNGPPLVDHARCLSCGRCIAVCPTGTLAEGQKGYRVQLGGKLGRHPQLAREMPGLYSTEKVVQIVAACLELYKSASRGGQRFGDILTPERFTALAERFGPGPPRADGN